MPSLLARIAGLTGAAALVLGGTLAAVPAAQAADGDNLVVTVVDTAGAATPATALLISGADPTSPITLGEVPVDGGPPRPASAFSTNVSPGTYGLVVITGWGGLTCIGVSPCSLLAIMGTPGGGAPTGFTVSGGIVVPETGVKTIQVKTELPSLAGGGNVGSALSLSFPAGYAELQNLLESYIAIIGGGFGGISTDPTVVWMRNGAPIAGASATSYVPTATDVGKKISAKITYNLFLAQILGMGGTFPIPGPFTTNAVTVKKVSTKVALNVPRKIKQGARPVLKVTAKSGRTDISGWVVVKFSGKAAQRVYVRRGFAQTKLPVLKPGKAKVTATYLATTTYLASKATKTVVVTPKKKKKK